MSSIREISNNTPNRGYGKFGQSSVDGRIYGNRSPVTLQHIISAASSFSSFVGKGLRKNLRQLAGALGFNVVTQDELADAKNAVVKAKQAKNEWYNSLQPSEQKTLADALIAQNATKTILAMSANRAIGLDFTFGVLDVGNDAALKVTTMNSLNRITGNAMQVESIEDRNIRAALEGMSSATAYQLVNSNHWNKLAKNVDELCQAVGTTIEKCVNSKVTGIPATNGKTTQFVASINPGVGRAAAEPVFN